MNKAMTDRDMIHAYLKSLSVYLSRLEAEDAAEVVREIESHIYDRLDAARSDDQHSAVESILAGLGEPRELAQSYVAHILTGAPPPRGFKAIERVKKTATLGLKFAMACFGFGIAACLAILAICELIYPDAVGVWSAANGNSIVIGVTDLEPGERQELLGAWLSPVFVLLAAAATWLTLRVLQALRVAKGH